MGGQAKRPTSGVPGAGGSSFYQNALNQAKEAVANVPATQAAHAQPGTTPNRPQPAGGPTVEGSPTQPQGQDNRFLDAYNNYMQQHGGGNQYPPAQGSPFGQAPAPAPAQSPAPPQAGPGPRRPMDQERPPTSPKGITMGAGYSNRPFR